MKAHHAWKNSPESIQITGVSTRGNVSSPVKITATRHDEALIEYGARKFVSTPAVHFRGDGEKETV